MGSIDARFSGNIFHKNFPQIIASDRALAKIIGIRAAWRSSDLAAGTVMARNNTTGFYVAYDDALASGAGGVAVGVLLDDVSFEASSGASGAGTQATRLCVGGAALYYDRLTGIDDNALTDMKGRVVVDASGTNLLEF